MRSLFSLLILSFLFFSNSNAENQQICDWIVDEVYADLLKQDSKDHLFVVVGNDGRCE